MCIDFLLLLLLIIIEARRYDSGSMAVRTQRHLGRDRRPHSGGILCLTELDPGW